MVQISLRIIHTRHQLTHYLVLVCNTVRRRTVDIAQAVNKPCHNKCIKDSSPNTRTMGKYHLF
jgi:hypothetical protein